MKDVLTIIKAIRESFGGSVAIYTYGNCYQFYEILKTIFPEAEAFDVGGHVWTKINGEYYDIKGKQNPKGINLIPIISTERIKQLSINKWTDERNKLYCENWIEEIKNKKL